MGWVPKYRVGPFKRALRQMLWGLVKTYRESPVKPKLIMVCAGSGNGFDPCLRTQEVVDEWNQGQTGRKDGSGRRAEEGFEASLISMQRDTWEYINRRDAV